MYLSTGTSSSPSGNTLGDGTENLATANADLEPERDRTYELGTKWAFAHNRVSLTSAVFRTETANARVAVAGGFQETIGDELVNGFEVGVSGNLTDRWSMLASYAFLHSEIVDDGPISTNEGKEFPNTPRNSFSLWSTYRVSRKISVGGGATYVDQRLRQHREQHLDSRLLALRRDGLVRGRLEGQPAAQSAEPHRRGLLHAARTRTTTRSSAPRGPRC